MTNKIPVEKWKPAVGYEGIYEISNHGRVKSLRRKVEKYPFPYTQKEMIMKLTHIVGYPAVTLRKNNKPKKWLVHRLVAFAFIPNPKNYKEINHIDYNPKNSLYTNLEWCSRSHNVKHGYANGRHKELRESKAEMLRKNPINPATKGELHGASILDNVKALYIRKKFKTRDYKLERLVAIKFNVSVGALRDVIRGKTWKHLL